MRRKSTEPFRFLGLLVSLDSELAIMKTSCDNSHMLQASRPNPNAQNDCEMCSIRGSFSELRRIRRDGVSDVAIVSAALDNQPRIPLFVKRLPWPRWFRALRRVYLPHCGNSPNLPTGSGRRRNSRRFSPIYDCSSVAHHLGCRPLLRNREPDLYWQGGSVRFHRKPGSGERLIEIVRRST